MSTFIYTPTNIQYLDSLFRNPISGRWEIPVLRFNTRFVNPFFGEVDSLNEDHLYQKRVIDHYYTLLTEKWLYGRPLYRSLLKYFKVSKDGDKGTVSLITNPDKLSESNVTKDDEKYVFHYIETHFITLKFVRKVLQEYVRTTHIKWYDLYNNNSALRDLFRHKLKRLILETIYEASGRS